jgi:hypothetical protein
MVEQASCLFNIITARKWKAEAFLYKCDPERVALQKPK